MRPPKTPAWVPVLAAFGLLAALIVGVLVVDSGRRSSTLKNVVPWVAQPASGATATTTSDVTVSLLVPKTAQAGTTLRYQVVLVNKSGTALALDPCPDYQQTFGSAVQPYGLNCTLAKPLPAKGSEVFDMQVAVPAGTSGPVELGWKLTSLAEGAGLTASITVER